MKRIVVIGSGNVAEGVAVGLTKAGLRPVQLFARNRAEGMKLAGRCGCGFASAAADLAPADLYLLAVSDRSIEPLSKRLDFGGAVVAHMAGSVEMDALSPKIARRAVLYPLQTFTKGREADWSDIPILIEGATPEALECVYDVARALSRNVWELSSEKRAWVHLAAVFASNFTNYMYTMGEEMLAGVDLPFDLLKPLIRETAEKAVASPSPRTVQTGPAVRNDFRTKTRHTELLAERPDYKSIYTNLSNHIWETSKKS